MGCHLLGGPGRVVGDEGDVSARLARSGDALGRVVDRVTVDVDHSVEVEHQQVVGRRQAGRARSRHRPAPWSLPLRCTDGVRSPRRSRRTSPARSSCCPFGPSRWRRDASATRRPLGSSRDPIAGSPSAWRRGARADSPRRDDEPSLYLHEYSDSGLTVRGLVGCLDISTHDHVATRRPGVPARGRPRPKQVTELATRMATMRINPAPILLVHRGPASIREVSRKVRTGTPEREYVDHAGQQHRDLERSRRPTSSRRSEAGLANARLLVADGHHRYAAYVALHGREPDEAHRSRPGHGGRPGRDPAVPRSRPPTAARREAGRPPHGRVGCRGTGAPDRRRRRHRRSGARHARAHRRAGLGDGQPRRTRRHRHGAARRRPAARRTAAAGPYGSASHTRWRRPWTR